MPPKSFTNLKKVLEPKFIKDNMYCSKKIAFEYISGTKKLNKFFEREEKDLTPIFQELKGKIKDFLRAWFEDNPKYLKKVKRSNREEEKEKEEKKKKKEEKESNNGKNDDSGDDSDENKSSRSDRSHKSDRSDRSDRNHPSVKKEFESGDENSDDENHKQSIDEAEESKQDEIEIIPEKEKPKKNKKRKIDNNDNNDSNENNNKIIQEKNTFTINAVKEYLLKISQDGKLKLKINQGGVLSELFAQDCQILSNGTIEIISASKA